MIGARQRRAGCHPLWRGIAAVVGVLLMAGSSLAAVDFLVGPGDRLSISVHRRADLSGEFRVLPGGALSLPFVGNLNVAGMSLEQIRGAIAQRLRDDAALLDPRVSVEISEMQPVLVSGIVRRPGQYPFQIGMTVGHAVAAAGGMRRFELEEVGARVEVMRLRERVREAQEATGVSLVRQARLLAEAAERETFDPPPAATRFLPAERLAEVVESERAIQRHRELAFRSLLELVVTQTAAFQDEIRALEEQTSAKERESELLAQESRYIEGLMRQGLTARDARIVQLARAAVQIDGERRQIMAFIARARQQIASTEQTRVNAITQRRLEIATSLKDAEDQMARLRAQIEESRAGLAQLRETLPPEDAPLGARTPPAFSILRVRASPPGRIDAHADTPLLPGDLVDVLGDETGARRLAGGAAR